MPGPCPCSTRIPRCWDDERRTWDLGQTTSPCCTRGYSFDRFSANVTTEVFTRGCACPAYRSADYIKWASQLLDVVSIADLSSSSDS